MRLLQCRRGESRHDLSRDCQYICGPKVSSIGLLECQQCKAHSSLQTDLSEASGLRFRRG